MAIEVDDRRAAPEPIQINLRMLRRLRITPAARWSR
jgi:hypothetical protein